MRAPGRKSAGGRLESGERLSVFSLGDYIRYMISHYTSIIIMCWLTLGSLCILVHKNNRITYDGKRLLYLTYSLIALSALAEWLGVHLDGRGDFPGWILSFVKCADYMLTPMAGCALAMQMNLRNRLQKVMVGIIIANTLFQLLAVLPGWMTVVDSRNHYSHGPLFPVYLLVCVYMYVLLFLQFRIYGRSFKRQNRMSLYAIMVLVIAGIIMQEISEGVRTSYLGLTIGAVLMFIHFTEFSQMEADDYIAQQQDALRTDPLTGLYNRYAYTQVLDEYASGELPENFAAFTIDINGLKRVNDTLGHEAGDELIRGAAACIEQTFGDEAECYRTGGDEFVAMGTEISRERADELTLSLEQETKKWHKLNDQKLSLAVGYALIEDNPDLTAEKLVRESDLAMYDAKAEYYRLSGRDRRRTG